MESTDEFLLSTGYEPNAYDFNETSVEPYMQLMDSPPLFSDKVSSADPDYDDAARTNSFCEKWHPPVCLFYKSENGFRFGEKCSYAHRQVEEQPSKRSKKNGDKSAVAMLKRNEHPSRTGRPVLDAYSSSTRQMGCVFQDMKAPKSSSILRKSTDMPMPIRCVKFTKANDILEGLYNLRIRESEKLKTVLELYDLEIHQKKLGPDYHRLKTRVKKKYRTRNSK